MENFFDLSSAVSSSKEESFGLSIVNPRVGREASDCGKSAATKEETRSSIAVKGEKANLSSGRRKTKEELNVRISLGSVHHSSSRLVEPVREVDEPMSSLDERDLVIPQNRGKNRSEVVTLRDHLGNRETSSVRGGGEKRSIQRTSASKTAMKSAGPFIPNVLASIIPKLIEFALLSNLSFF